MFQLTPAGGEWTYTSLYDFCGEGWPCSDGAQPAGDLAVDANGNFYGTASIGGTNGYGVVWKIAPGGLPGLRHFERAYSPE